MLRSLLFFSSGCCLMLAAAPVMSAAATHRGFMADNNFGSLYVYDWSTSSLTGSAPRNGNLNCNLGTAFSADLSKLFVANCLSGQVSVLDVETLTYAPSTLQVGGPALYLAAGPTGRFLYVTSAFSLVVIDLSGALPNQTIALTAQPFRLAVTPDNTNVAIIFRGHPMAAVVRIGTPHTLRGYVNLNGPANDVVISPDSRRAVLAMLDLGSVANVQLASLTKTEWPTAGCKPNSVSFSPAGTRLYLSCLRSGPDSNFQIVHGVTGAHLHTGVLPNQEYQGPRTVTVTPDGKHAWFPGEPFGHTWVLDTTTLGLKLIGGAEYSDTKLVFGKPLYGLIDAVSGLASSTAARESAPAACAPGQVYRVTAKWRNNSARTWNNLLAEVLTLTGGNTLIEQTWDLTADGAVNPGEYFGGVFRIRLATCAPFSFQVSLAASGDTAAISPVANGLRFAMPASARAEQPAPDLAGPDSSSWTLDPLE